MSKEYFNWLKEHHICISCCNENAERGRTKCIMCLAKDAERHAKKYDVPESRTKMNEANRKSYHKTRQERIEQGLCPRCGKRKPTEGYKMCAICRNKERIHRENQRRQAGVMSIQIKLESDVCYFCGAERMKGHKVCEKCYERQMKLMQNCHAHRNNKGHKWKADNLNAFGGV